MAVQFEKLVFLVGGTEATPVIEILSNFAPDTPLEIATNLEELQQALTPNCRLITFGSPLIVPKELLDVLNMPAYNIHPGPPEHPGIYPSVFALYTQEEKFGTTIHEMSPRVDEGPIVSIDRFRISKNIHRLALDTQSFLSVLSLCREIGHDLVTKPRLSPIDEQWANRKHTKKEFNALCKLPDDINHEEFQRRYRAIGEGPDHALEINLFGHRFVLNNQQTNEILCAGQSLERN